MKRILALLLSLIMCLTLIPAAAAEDAEIVEIEPVGVGAFDDPSDEELIEIVDPEALAEAIPNAKPTITASPKNVTAYVGTTAKFTVKASGAESYQWYYRKNADASWAKTSLTGNTTATLSVKANETRSDYQYRCKVTNSDGYAYSSAATLTVSEKPVITSQPASQTAAAGATVKFTIKADGADTYQWYYRTSSTGSWAKSTTTGAKTATLSIAAETKRNGYQYRCKVTNAKGNVYSSAATLTVAAKPTVSTQPLNYTAGVGATIYFKVTATGAESYQWQYRTSSSGSWKSTTLTGNKTGTLTVKATAARDGYQYRCKITNAAGSTYSKAATLTVSALQCGDNLTWKLSSSGLLTISGKGAMYDFSAEQPTPWREYKASDIKKITISSGVTSVGYGAFNLCGNLTSVSFPSSLTSINTYAFYGCEALTTVTIPSGVTSIGESAFEYCAALATVKIPGSVVNIGPWAFADCTSLKTLTLGSGVTSIGNWAFMNCKSLKSVTIPDSVVYIENQAFAYSGLTSVTIPAGASEVAENAFGGCKSLTAIQVASGNPNYSSQNGVMFNKDKTELIQYPCGKTATSYTVPSGVNAIGSSAFEYNVSLKTINIGAGVSVIDGWAFYGCESLTAIQVDADNPNFSSKSGVLFNKDATTLIKCPCAISGAYAVPSGVDFIDEWAFAECINITTVTLPSSVMYINYGAFQGCKGLKSITIGTGVTYISDDAFYDCNALTDVFYKGGQSDWEQIEIGESNDCLLNATLHYYS